MKFLNLLFLLIFFIKILYSTEVSVFRESNNSEELLLIPVKISSNDLIFKKKDTFFCSRFRIIVEIKDENGEIIAGDIWNFNYTLYDFSETISSSNSFSEILLLRTDTFNHGTIILIIKDINSMDEIIFSREIFSKSNIGDIIIFQDLTILLKNEFQTNTSINFMTTINEGECYFYIKRRSNIIDSSSTIPYEIFGQNFYFCEMLTPADTGKYTVIATNHIDSSFITIHIKDFIYEDSVNIERKINQMYFVLNPDSLRKIKRLNISEKKIYLNLFWGKHDPSPITQENEIEDLYYKRIEFAEKMYYEGEIGWKTDRGIVFVLLGFPDEIEDYPFQIDSPPYQFWYYYSMGLRFKFIDNHLIGSYKLVEPGGWINGWLNFFDFNE